MRFFHTLGGYVTGVLTVYAAIFVVGYFRLGSTPGHPLLDVFGGYMPGMLAMYIAARVYRQSRFRNLDQL
jgi:membrane-associated phospholipid phosphatase